MIRINFKKNARTIGLLMLMVSTTLLAGPNEDLWKSAEEGNLAGVQNALDKGANINAKNAYGGTALFPAAGRGHLKVVKFLIAKKIDVSAKSKYGGTALFWAVEKGRVEIVKILITAKIDINAYDTDSGGTALMGAAEMGMFEIVKLLIEAKADVNLKDEKGNTALMSAQKKGHIEIIKLLQQAGTNSTTIKPFQNNPKANKLLNSAIKDGNLTRVKKAIKLGANINHTDKNRDTLSPLFLAIKSKNFEIVDYLLSKGANVHQTSSGAPAIFLATFMNHKRILNRIIKAGADIHAEAGNDAFTPLLVAAYRGKLNSAIVLEAAGVNINYQNSKHKITALHMAIDKRQYELCLFLIEKGADVYLENAFGQSSMSQGLSSNNKKIKELFQKIKASGSARTRSVKS